MAKISIIIPVYNSEKYLNKCLTSIINQTFRDIELICINDGSTDKSLDILEEFAKKYPIIHIINRVHEGPGPARNYALDTIESEFVGFVDSDDDIDSTYYEDLYKSALQNDSDIVLNRKINYRLENNVHQIIELNSPHNIYELKEQIIVDSIQPWTKLYRKSYLDEYKIRFGLQKGEDIPFCIKSCLYTEKISSIDTSQYNCLVRENSSSHTMADIDLSEIDEFANLLTLITQMEFQYPKEKKFYQKVVTQRLMKSFKIIYSIIPKEKKQEFVNKCNKRFEAIELDD